MLSGLYDYARQLFAQAELNWLGHEFKAALVQIDSAYGETYLVDFANHQFLSQVNSLAIIGYSDAFLLKSTTKGICGAGPIKWTMPIDGMRIGAFVVYRDTGDPSTSPVVLYVDATRASLLPFTTNGAQITCYLPNKLFKL
jgi:hypothetical protein